LARDGTLPGFFGPKPGQLNYPNIWHPPTIIVKLKKYTFGTGGRLTDAFNRWERNRAARILEKQNRLQMSQVFPVSCIDDQMGLAFQGFYKRGRFTQPMLFPRGLANP